MFFQMSKAQVCYTNNFKKIEPSILNLSGLFKKSKLTQKRSYFVYHSLTHFKLLSFIYLKKVYAWSMGQDTNFTPLQETIMQRLIFAKKDNNVWNHVDIERIAEFLYPCFQNCYARPISQSEVLDYILCLFYDPALANSFLNPEIVLERILIYSAELPDSIVRKFYMGTDMYGRMYKFDGVANEIAERSQTQIYMYMNSCKLVPPKMEDFLSTQTLLQKEFVADMNLKYLGSKPGTGSFLTKAQELSYFSKPKTVPQSLVNTAESIKEHSLQVYHKIDTEALTSKLVIKNQDLLWAPNNLKQSLVDTASGVKGESLHIYHKIDTEALGALAKFKMNKSEIHLTVLEHASKIDYLEIINLLS